MDFDLITLFDTIGFLQGLICGLTLIIVGLKRKGPVLFLGMFVVAYSTELLATVLEQSGAVKLYPGLDFIPIFYFIRAPLIYFYALSIGVRNINQRHYWLLVPGVVELMLFLTMLASNTTLTPTMYKWFWISVGLSSIVFSLVVLARTILWINRFQYRIHDYMAVGDEKVLNWVKHVAVFLSVYILVFVNAIWFKELRENYFFELLYVLVNVGFIYWVTIQGLRQMPLTEVDSDVRLAMAKATESTRSLASAQLMTTEDVEEAYDRLSDFMEGAKPFMDTNLTLFQLAEMLNIHAKKLSYVINTKANLNFNQFINNFRVREAKDILRSEKYNYLSMEGIAYHVGFNSKSTFYTVFKSITNTTPSNYKNGETVAVQQYA